MIRKAFAAIYAITILVITVGTMLSHAFHGKREAGVDVPIHGASEQLYDASLIVYSVFVAHLYVGIKLLSAHRTDRYYKGFLIALVISTGISMALAMNYHYQFVSTMVEYNIYNIYYDRYASIRDRSVLSIIIWPVIWAIIPILSASLAITSNALMKNRPN